MKILLVVLMFALGGCSFLERQSREQEPQTAVNPAANLANGYILLAQVRLLAADAVKNGLVSAEEGKRALQLTDTARQTLDSARDAHFAGVAGASNKGMEIADVILNQLQNDLLERIAVKKAAKAKEGK